MRFQEFLSAEFDRRRARNPRYSLRRFAGAVQVHHATLSRLLRSPRPLQARTVAALGASLGLATSQIHAFIAREEAEAVCLAIGRAAFRPDSRWLATVCGISVDRVNVALQALLGLGRLRMVATNAWIVDGSRSQPR